MRIFGFFLIRILALPLGAGLFLCGWKRRTLLENRRRCGVGGPFFRLGLCLHVGLDFLRMLIGNYGKSIRIREKDKSKLKKLKSEGSLLLTAHFHHWELMGGWMVSQGVPLLCAARPLAFRPAQQLLQGMRRRLRLPCVEQHLPRKALRHMGRRGCFALLWDQRVLRSPVEASFFGSVLALDPLPDFLLRHRSLPVWFGVLLPNGAFRLLLLAAPRNPGPSAHRPFEPRAFGTEPNRAHPGSAQLARRYHRVLELLIRRHPTWWYGMAHRRFLGARTSARTRLSTETTRIELGEG